MKKNQQYFAPVCDGRIFRIHVTRHPLRKKLTMQIDDETFELPWGAREEIFRLGDEQAVLCVAKNGRIAIRLRDGEVPECDPLQSE
ncbi:MAG: hypothetical protein IJW40_00920 [Clostridia bacterium]|nr:hypothetical protein [Clostridia bacterium]